MLSLLNRKTVLSVFLTSFFLLPLGAASITNDSATLVSLENIGSESTNFSITGTFQFSFGGSSPYADGLPLPPTFNQLIGQEVSLLDGADTPVAGTPGTITLNGTTQPVVLFGNVNTQTPGFLFPQLNPDTSVTFSLPEELDGFFHTSINNEAANVTLRLLGNTAITIAALDDGGEYIKERNFTSTSSDDSIDFPDRAIPEPGTTALVLMGLVGMFGFIRRKA